MRGRGDARFLTPVVALVAALAWVPLFRLHGAGAGHHMHGHSSGLLDLFGIVAGEGRLKFLAGWLLMTVAMMLPTTLPLVETVRRRMQGRPGQCCSLLLLLAGYLCVWFTVGVVILLLWTGAEEVGLPSALSQGTARIQALLFLVAGTVQFLPAKHRCREMCRAPLGCSSPDAPDGHQTRRPFRMGFRHGVSCVGCCWALMLLMFAAGSAHLIWMIGLTAVMTAEKNFLWGRKLTLPLGACLVAGAALHLLVR